VSDRSKLHQNSFNLDLLLVDLVEFYQKTNDLNQFETLISAYQYRRIYQLVLKYLSPEMTVLDWGSGNGHFSYFLVNSGYKTSGYGFVGVPKICQSFSPDQYTYKEGNWSDPIALPFPDGHFDSVVSIGVLEHVRETGGTEISSLNEIHRILKPNGLFICVHFPNRYSWIEYAARMMKKWSHEYCYTDRDIRSLAELSQFQILEIQRYAFLPRNIWSKIPGNLGNSSLAIQLYNRIDRFLSIPFSGICQNYLFVAQKSEL
jgi:cyclopropane fatty-acyl-phospholipid synthase-like methyltransferase